MTTETQAKRPSLDDLFRAVATDDDEYRQLREGADRVLVAEQERLYQIYRTDPGRPFFLVLLRYCDSDMSRANALYEAMRPRMLTTMDGWEDRRAREEAEAANAR